MRNSSRIHNFLLFSKFPSILDRFNLINWCVQENQKFLQKSLDDSKEILNLMRFPLFFLQLKSAGRRIIFFITTVFQNCCHHSHPLWKNSSSLYDSFFSCFLLFHPLLFTIHLSFLIHSFSLSSLASSFSSLSLTILLLLPHLHSSQLLLHCIQGKCQPFSAQIKSPSSLTIEFSNTIKSQLENLIKLIYTKIQIVISGFIDSISINFVNFS